MKQGIVLFLAILGCLAQSTVWATPTEILPISYHFDKLTDCGSYCYQDELGNQLIDGISGIAPWSANLGNGSAFEWVGWMYDSPVNIDFDFGLATHVDVMNIGSVQDHVNDVVLPSLAIFSSPDGGFWSAVASLVVPESSANNNTHHIFTFENLGINAQYVRVSLTHSLNGPWTFVDEVDFFQETAHLPEPGTWVLFSTGLVGLVSVGWRRRQQNTA
jgi:hypothetical protein